MEGEVWERAWMISLVQSGEEEERRAEFDMLVVMWLIVWSESRGKQEVPWGSVMRRDLSPSSIADGTTDNWCASFFYTRRLVNRPEHACWNIAQCS